MQTVRLKLSHRAHPLAGVPPRHEPQLPPGCPHRQTHSQNGGSGAMLAPPAACTRTFLHLTHTSDLCTHTRHLLHVVGLHGGETWAESKSDP